MRHLSLLLLIAVVATTGCGGAATPAEIAIASPTTQRNPPAGPVIGFEHRYSSHAWLGIPYAEAPLGDLRWRAPRPRAAWTTPLEALHFGTPCPQIGSPLGGVGKQGANEGSEDCLYLNIYAPRMSAAEAATSKLPVMMWIHGGGNTIGAASFYDGGNLAASEKVIVVTINYRLGPEGWFYHPALAANASPEDASGNYGTLDAIGALKWIQSNIAAFGGDPSNITVFGESAGGTNTLSLLLSPTAAGLFQRAISQSGGLGFSTVDEAYRASDDSPKGHRNSSTEVIARLLIADKKAKDRSEALAQIAAMKAEQLAAYLRGKDIWEIYAACGDKGLLGPQLPAVIQDGTVIRSGDPYALLADPAAHNDVPMIVGTNRDEPKIFMAFDPNQVTRLFGIPLWAKDATSYDQQAHYGALSWKIRGVDDIAAQLIQHGQPAYAYRWDWDEEGTRFGFVDISQLLGAAHGLEIPFVFGHFDLGPQSALMFDDDNTPGRDKLSSAMRSYWAQFAYTGNPGRGRNNDLPEWHAFSPNDNSPKSILLDTDAGGGIRMTTERATRESLLAALEHEAMDPQTRCALFARTFRFEADDDWTQTAWQKLSGGACATFDRSELAGGRR